MIFFDHCISARGLFMRKSSIVSTLSALSIACNAMDNKPKPQLLINPPPTVPDDNSTESETSEKETEQAAALINSPAPKTTAERSSDQGDEKPDSADKKSEAAESESEASTNETAANDGNQPN